MSKKAKHPHSGTPGLLALEKAGVEHEVLTYIHDPDSGLAFGIEAAQAIGVDPDQVFKTLLARGVGTLVVGVVPVNRRLDLKALAGAVGGKKATMAEPADAERATGYVVGGISPLGQRQRHTTVLDESALGHARVYVSGGRRGLDVGLAPGDLIALTNATAAPIARD